MLNNIFLIVLACVLIGLGAVEVFRFRRSRADRSEIAYPPARLKRRLIIAAIAVGLLALGEFDPKGLGPSISLTWVLALMAGAWFMLRLVLKDLRETSVAAVVEKRRMQDSLEQRLRAAMETIENEEQGKE